MVLSGAPMLRAQLLSPKDLSARDRDCWRDLQATAPEFRNPLLGPEFAALVGEVRSDAAVLALTRNGRPVGFLPHHRRPFGVGRPIGAPFSDLHGLVCEEGLGLDDEAIIRHAGLKSFRFSSLIDPHRIFEGSTLERQPSWRISGERAFETVREAHNVHFKKMLRHTRKLVKVEAELSVEFHDRRPAALESMFRWKRDQLNKTGLHDFLRPEWTRGLMRIVSESPFVSVVTLNVGGEPVAGRFGITVGGACHVWITAFDPNFGTYSPGTILLWRFIEAMPALGIDTCDLGPGGDREKAICSTGSLQVGAGAAPYHRRPLFRAPKSMRQRLEQITQVELGPMGRAYGVMSALVGQARRSRRRNAAAAVAA
jgi:CelD/BcsL family acetyltransferase involved in cellulose biosynthesis